MADPVIPADGTQKHYTLSADGYLDKRPLAFSDRVKHLVGFCERFMFFSPAILYLWGGFEDRILVDFLDKQSRPIEFYYYRFNKPIFRGLDTPDGNADWNHVIWAIEQDIWPAFLDHMCAAVLHDDRQQLVFRVGYQKFDVLDPLYMDRAVVLSSVAPIVNIGSFGVTSNKFTVALRDSQQPGLLPPTVQLYPADKVCQAYATALFRTESLNQLSTQIDGHLQEQIRGNQTHVASGNEG